MYQDYIKEENPSFYERILPHIDSLPDFRPLETVKKMKKVEIDGSLRLEPQNNWRIVYEEFSALSTNPFHFSILEDILNREMIDIENESVKEFAIYYPSLTWLMVRIASPKSIYPLCLSQSIYLDEVIKKETWKKYIGYIRSIETAKKLSPAISEERIQSIFQVLQDDSFQIIGWAYCALAKNMNLSNFHIEFIANSIADERNLDLFKAMKSIFLECKGVAWIQIMIGKSFAEALQECSDIMDQKMIYWNLGDAIQRGIVTMVKFFLYAMDSSEITQYATDIIRNAIDRPHPKIIRILIEHPIIKTRFHRVAESLLCKLAKWGRKEIIGILFLTNIGNHVWRKMIKDSIRYGHEEIAQMILKNKEIEIYFSDIHDVIISSSSLCLKDLLDKTKPLANYEKEILFTTALFGEHIDAIRILMEHKNMKNENLSQTYIKLAKDLVK